MQVESTQRIFWISGIHDMPSISRERCCWACRHQQGMTCNQHTCVNLTCESGDAPAGPLCAAKSRGDSAFGANFAKLFVTLSLAFSYFGVVPTHCSECSWTTHKTLLPLLNSQTLLHSLLACQPFRVTAKRLIQFGIWHPLPLDVFSSRRRCKRRKFSACFESLPDYSSL